MTQHWYYSRTGCDGMGMCCEKKMMTVWRNAWSMKLRVQDQVLGRPKRTWREVVEKDCQACKLNKEYDMDRSKRRRLIKDVRWSGAVWVGECFFWYRPTWVVPDQRPLNSCVCVCIMFTLGIIELCAKILQIMHNDFKDYARTFCQLCAPFSIQISINQERK